MELTQQQRQKLVIEHGIYRNEACDKCGVVLGEIRYTRLGEAGMWCSRICRDGIEVAEAYGSRHSGAKPKPLIKRIATPAMLAGLAKARAARSNQQKQVA